MNKDQAVKLLKSGQDGIVKWNACRDSGEEIPELNNIDLSETNLSGINFNSVNLSGTSLYGTDLDSAWLNYADLTDANLMAANLEWAELNNADLTEANLSSSNLRNCDLRDAILCEAKLSRANLENTDLTRAKLIEAYLPEANLSGADLSEADLNRADLAGAHLSDVILKETDLTNAYFGSTKIACNLSVAKGLDETKHYTGSHVSTASILSFSDKLPEVFLRGCGLSDEEIAHYRRRINCPNKYYSCFISYNTKDEDLASKLHSDFQKAGIRCWKWDHDARTGETLWSEITRGINEHDKLVLIASRNSLQSPAVNREIERAIEKEDELKKLKTTGKYSGNTNVLFPVKVDEYIFANWDHERKNDVTKMVITDACNWTNQRQYEKVRVKLINDLTIIREQ